MIECPICGVSFIAKMKTHLYCSATCRERRKRVILRETGQDKVLQKRYRDKPNSKILMREYHLKRNYGLTIEQYNELLEKQGGGCAVCGKTPEQEKKALAVEHDHRTGEIFGLCCYRCNNKIIGKIRDADLFEKVSKYLRNGTGLFIPPDAPKVKRSRKKRPPIGTPAYEAHLAERRRRRTARKVK